MSLEVGQLADVDCEALHRELSPTKFRQFSSPLSSRYHSFHRLLDVQSINHAYRANTCDKSI